MKKRYGYFKVDAKTLKEHGFAIFGDLIFVPKIIEESYDGDVTFYGFSPAFDEVEEADPCDEYELFQNPNYGLRKKKTKEQEFMNPDLGEPLEGKRFTKASALKDWLLENKNKYIRFTPTGCNQPTPEGVCSGYRMHNEEILILRFGDIWHEIYVPGVVVSIGDAVVHTKQEQPGLSFPPEDYLAIDEDGYYQPKDKEEFSTIFKVGDLVKIRKPKTIFSCPYEIMDIQDKKVYFHAQNRMDPILYYGDFKLRHAIPAELDSTDGTGIRPRKVEDKGIDPILAWLPNKEYKYCVKGHSGNWLPIRPDTSGHRVMDLDIEDGLYELVEIVNEEFFRQNNMFLEEEHITLIKRNGYQYTLMRKHGAKTMDN